MDFVEWFSMAIVITIGALIASIFILSMDSFGFTIDSSYFLDTSMISYYILFGIGVLFVGFVLWFLVVFIPERSRKIDQKYDRLNREREERFAKYMRKNNEEEEE